MDPKLDSWTPLTCQEVYEIITSPECSGDCEQEKQTDSNFKKSFIWYFKAFDLVNETSFESITPLVKTLYTKYGLSSQEVMQILDIKPKKLVDLHCTIPNCGKRLSEKETEDILELLNKTFSRKNVGEGDFK
ncbi:hypothetical protein FG386_001415 [Cryptosporidium ryanae]|uniref:uncharacterized protein n=1 Tax=Cryptosporidium ryanae TaxID=515981 RepID=UPI00351A56B9|nr:hypothetical protein FG386_001415 [Cryptosporidium ryanae]